MKKAISLLLLTLALSVSAAAAQKAAEQAGPTIAKAESLHHAAQLPEWKVKMLAAFEAEGDYATCDRCGCNIPGHFLVCLGALTCYMHPLLFCIWTNPPGVD